MNRDRSSGWESVTRFPLTDGRWRRGGLVCLGALCLVLIGIAGTEAKADEAAAKKTELDGMKDEFAALMKRRVAIAEQTKESTARINAARSMLAGNPQANTGAAKQYREATARVETALDRHPQVRALQEQYEAVQTQKVAVSKQKAETMAAWRKTREKRMAEFRTAVELAGKKAEDDRAGILKQAGVKQYSELPDADKTRYQEVEKAWTNEFLAAKAVLGDGTDRTKDGSSKRLSELDRESKALEARLGELRTQIGQLRVALRKSDPAIVSLLAAEDEARQAHVVAVDASAEVGAARKFIEGAERERADIDRRANALRSAIIEKDPAYKVSLDLQGSAAGFGA